MKTSLDTQNHTIYERRLNFSSILRHPALKYVVLFGVLVLYTTITTIVAYKAQWSDAVDVPSGQIPIWFDTDDAMWVEMTQQSAEQGHWRTRWLDNDNYPHGRAVHWSSLPVWGIRVISLVVGLVTGLPPRQAIEIGAIFLQPLMQMFTSCVLALLLCRAVGFGPGALLTLAVVFSAPWRLAFMPIHPDHQSLVVAVLIVLCLTMQIAASARGQHWSWTVSTVSGIAAGLALWVSAINTLPVIFLCGVAGIASVVVAGKASPSAARSLAWGWRAFGVAAGVVSLLAWVVEYFPGGHLRLEANHPLYSFGMVGGGFLAGELARCVSSRDVACLDRRAAAYGFLLLAPLLVTVAVLREAAFAALDPDWARFMWNIAEMRPAALHEMATNFGVFVVLMTACTALVVLLSGGMLTEARGLMFAVVASGGVMSLWLENSRWAAIAVPISMVICSIAILRVAGRDIIPLRALLVAAICVSAVAGLASWVGVTKGTWEGKYPIVTADIQHDLASVATAINDDRANLPAGTRIVVASPLVGQMSFLRHYLPDAATIGTIYWECTDGLKALGRIFANSDMDAVERELKNRRVTHVVMDQTGASIALVLSAHGRVGMRRTSKDYAPAVWLDDKKRPNWLHKIPVGGNSPYVVFRVDWVTPAQKDNTDGAPNQSDLASPAF